MRWTLDGENEECGAALGSTRFIRMLTSVQAATHIPRMACGLHGSILSKGSGLGGRWRLLSLSSETTDGWGKIGASGKEGSSPRAADTKIEGEAEGV